MIHLVPKNLVRSFALLLLNQNQKNEVIQVETIVQSISINLSTLKMDLEETTKVSSLDSSGTTLFIIIYLAKVSQYLLRISSTTDFISKQFEPKMRPRCLIVLPNKDNFSYLKLLRLVVQRIFLCHYCGTCGRRKIKKQVLKFETRFSDDTSIPSTRKHLQEDFVSTRSLLVSRKNL